MENLKVKVRSADESKEAQELFFSLGVSWRGSDSRNPIVSSLDYPFFVVSDFEGLHLTDSKLLTDFKEITLQELRDMVVLKRNDVGDANYTCDREKKYYATGDDVYMYVVQGEWSLCKNLTLEKAIEVWGLKPIKEGVMREYLFKYNDQYTLVELSKEAAESNPEQYIEIPDGADCLTSCNNVLIFWKGQDYSFDIEDDKDWIYYADGSMTLDYYSNFYKENGVVILWQRESLNDKIATAEVARQEEKHNHYKKDVSHLNVIDPYRIAVLYNLHPCADHIMKKSLCAGNRGHKDTLRDIQDIIDTAERWKQMVEEDSNEI